MNATKPDYSEKTPNYPVVFIGHNLPTMSVSELKEIFNKISEILDSFEPEHSVSIHTQPDGKICICQIKSI